MLNRLKNRPVYSVSRRVQLTAVHLYNVYLYIIIPVYREYLHNIIIAAVVRGPFTYLLCVGGYATSLR